MLANQWSSRQERKGSVQPKPTDIEGSGRCHENVEALDLGDVKFPILQDMPAALERGFHLMIKQHPTEWNRRPLIKQDLPAGFSNRGFKAALSTLKDGLNLIAPNAGK